MVNCYDHFAKKHPFRNADGNVAGGGEAELVQHEKFIREVARILKQYLEVDINVDSDSLSDLTAKISEELNSAEFSKSPEVQSELNSRLNSAVSELSGEVEDSDLESVIKRIDEIVSKTAGGMAAVPIERLTVFPKLIDQATALLTVADNNLKMQASAVKSLTGPQKESAQMLASQAEDLMRDVQSILNSLRGHLKGVKPKVDTLKDLVSNNEDFRKKLEAILKLDLSGNASDRADALAAAMKRLGFLPIVAKQVRDALKTINISIKEFVASPTFNSLMKKADDNILSGDMAAKVQAMDAIARSYSRGMHHSLTKELTAKGGARDPPSKYKKSLKVAKKVRDVTISLFDRTLRALLTEFDNQAHKFAEEMRLGKIKDGEPVEKFIDALGHLENVIRSKENRNLQLSLVGWNVGPQDLADKKEFLSALQYAYNTAKEVASPAATAMGKSIEKIKVTIDRYSDALRKSDDARMPVAAAGTEGGGSLGMLAAAPLAAGLAVKGYNEYVERKPSDDSSDTIGGADELNSANISGVTEVSSTVDPRKIDEVCDLDMPSENVKTAGAPFDFADPGAVATEYTEIAVAPLGAVSAGCGCDGGSDQGSWASVVATSGTEAGMGPPGTVSAGAVTIGSMSTGIYSLAQSIKELKYYHRIIKVHEHMKESGDMLSGTDSDFKKILGKAMGARKNVINKDFENAMKYIEEHKSTGTGPKTLAQSAKQYYVELHDATISFYDTLEALEIYLKNFTDGILNHPEDIADILTMLNGTQVIVKWFDDKSATNISNTFDKFGVDLGAGKHPEEYEDLKMSLSRAFDGVDTLKNVMNAFARIGDKFGKDKIQTNMSIGAMYKNLKNFLVISYIRMLPSGLLALGTGNVAVPATTPGVSADAVHIPNVVAERALFADMVKAMAAKVFTVTGLYDMVNRPLDKGGNFYNVLLRSTVGGGAPKIHTDAVELYIRLPLLAEWYREIFNFRGQTGNPSISMIPDYGNIWKELQEIMYHTAGYVANGLYSDAQFQSMISAINKVYEHYHSKHGKNACIAAIKGFIEDTNMRYGVMWQKDVIAYNEARGRLTTTDLQKNNARDRPDYEILPGEGDDAYASPGPSSDYTNPVFLPSTTTGKEGEVDIFQSRGLIRNFRARIIQAFNLRNPMEAIKNINFVDKIRQCREDLDRSSDSTDRYHVMLRTLQDANRVGSGRLTTLLMFHEQIVYGAEVACTILEMLNNFKVNVEQLDDTPPDNANFIGITPSIRMNTRDKLQTIYDLIEGFAHCNVQIRMDNEHLSIDFSELFECVKQLVSSIRDNLPKFQGKIDRTIIDRYEKSTESYSLASLEFDIQHLIDQEISQADDVTAYRDGKKYAGVPRAVSRLDTVYSSLQGNVSFTFLLSDVTSVRPITAELTNDFTNLQGLLKMVDGGNKRITLDILTGDARRRALEQGVSFKTDTTIADDASLCDSMTEQFNTLLLHYLNTFFDLSDNNIYVNLIKPIVSAMHSDVYGDIDRDTQVLLHKSNVYVLNTMMTGTLDVRKPSNKAFIGDNFASVSDFMKETMRCNLPYYHTLFHRVHVNIITIRNMLSHKTINVANKVEMLKTVENVIKGCNSMRQAIESVMAELKDVSIAFETSSRFVTEYKAMYGKTPVLPASTLSVWLKNGTDASRSLFPDKQASVDPTFKLMYGVRDVLNTKDGCKPSNFKYNSELLKAYNHISSAPTKILDADHNKYLECVCSLAKYAIYTKYWTCSTDMVKVCEVTYQSTGDVNRVVELLESGQQDQQLSAMVDDLNRGGPRNTNIGGVGTLRNDARIVNILDLNVMPINIHMLTTQVPLTEVYSYSWTFDHLVGSLTSSDFQTNQASRTRISARTDGEGATLAVMLNNPYRPVPDAAYYRQVQRLVAGLGDLPLGRPRYLDQLWKKVLGEVDFGSYTDANRSPGEDLARSEGRTLNGSQVPTNDIPGVAAADWEGIAKFNTYLMRDQFFLCNLQRILRYQMRRDLFKSLGPVVSSHDAVGEHVTEVGSNREIHDEKNDVLTSEYLVFQ